MTGLQGRAAGHAGGDGDALMSPGAAPWDAPWDAEQRVGGAGGDGASEVVEMTVRLEGSESETVTQVPVKTVPRDSGENSASAVPVKTVPLDGGANSGVPAGGGDSSVAVLPDRAVDVDTLIVGEVLLKMCLLVQEGAAAGRPASPSRQEAKVEPPPVDEDAERQTVVGDDASNTSNASPATPGSAGPETELLLGRVLAGTGSQAPDVALLSTADIAHPQRLPLEG